MSTPIAPSPVPPPAAATVSSGQRFWATIRGWGVVRGEDRWIAGVCGGLAQRAGIDPLVLRGLLIALTVVGGLGLALYGIAWALLPDPAGRIEAESVVRGDISGALALCVGLVILDLAVGRGLVGLGWWDSGPGGGFLITALVATLLWWLLRDSALLRRPKRAASTVEASAVPVSSTPTAPTSTVPVRVSLVKEPQSVTVPMAGYGSATERRAAARAMAADARRRAEARRRPGSPLATTAVLGLALLAAGTVLALGQLFVFGADEVPLALAAAVAVMGLGAVVAGLRGRRTALVGLAVPVAVLAVAASALPAGGGWQWQVNRSWTPTASSLRDQPQTASVLGRLEVDPSALRSAAAGAPPLRTTATIAAGQLAVVVPTTATVLVDVQVGAGSITVHSSPQIVRLDTGADSDAPSSTAGSIEYGGLGVHEVYAVGPQASAVAAGTTVRGDDVTKWTVPSAAGGVLQANVWTGGVVLGSAGDLGSAGAERND